jgi:enterochelin esterase family protein
MRKAYPIIAGLLFAAVTFAQQSGTPARDPHSPGFALVVSLPGSRVPPPTQDGDFLLGSAHPPSPDAVLQSAIPHGRVVSFTLESTASRYYPGIARTQGTFGTPDPHDSARLVVTTSHPAPYTRTVTVYIPAQYSAGTPAPLIVGADGPDTLLFTALDDLIASRQLPPIIAVSIANGGGDAQGSERGLEYDTMSGRYAEFVEREVLPQVESRFHVRLTHDPEARATMGGSSGAAAALFMAWFHPELYRRVLSYSGTWINQQWPPNPESPHGAFAFPEHLIRETPPKPIRIWLEVGDRDLLNPNVMRDGMHDWVVANEMMAQALAARGYHYQFVFAQNAGHVDRAVRAQTLPEALLYVWQNLVLPTR